LSWRTTLARRGSLIALGAAVALGGAAAWAIGPGAAGLVDHFADGQRVWRLGRLQLDGVRGPHLGRLTARRALILDESGVWLQADDLALRWDPLALLSGRVAVDFATIEQAAVLRRPTLAPPSGGQGPDLRVAIDRAVIARLRLAPGVAGEASAEFTVEGALLASSTAVREAALQVARLDAPSDRLALAYDAGATESLQARLEGGPGGAFAALLELPPGAGVFLTASARGDDAAGQARAEGRIGPEPVLDLAVDWGDGVWSGQAQVAAAEIPILADLAQRLGGPLLLRGQGDLPGGRGAGRFQASASAPRLQAALAGALEDGLTLAGPASLELETDALGALIGQPDLSGEAAFDGDLRHSGARWSVTGALRAEELTFGEVQAALRGPVALALAPAEILAEADLEATVAGSGPAATLLRDLALEADARFDRRDQALYLRRLRVQGPNLELNASGALPPGGRISGRWALPQLEAVSPQLGGAAAGKFAVLREPEALRVSIEGAGRRLAGPDWLETLLGDRPRLDLEATLRGEQVLLRRAALQGPQLRAGASGTLTAAAVDLRLEGSLQGPFAVGGAEVDGALDVVGGVEGALPRPAVRLNASLAQLQVAALRFEDAGLSLQLDGGPVQTGVLALDASFNGQPVSARSGLRISDAGLAFNDLTAQAGRLALSGALLLGSRGPEGALALEGGLGGLWPGVSGRVAGRVALEPTGTDQPRLQAELELQRFRIGERLRLQTASLDATGPLDDLTWRTATEGQAGGLPLRLAARGKAGFGADGPSLLAEIEGAYAQRAVATLEPLRVRTGEAGLSAAGALQLDGGSARFTLQQGSESLELEANLQRAPLALLSAFTEDPLAGAVDGRVTLSGRNARLSGAADLRFDDARFARRARDPVDATLTARLQDDRLTGSLQAMSQAGLQASVDLRAPVVASAAPFRLALGEGPALADWRVDGPIGGVWDLFSPLDQRLTGVLRGQGRAELAPGRVSGRGDLTLTEATFADKLTGLRLTDIDAALRFDPAGAELVRLSAKGPRGGAVTGSGRVAGPEQGALNLQFSDLLLVDRPDIEAQADGDLRFAWDSAGSRLGGAITIAEATLQVDELRDASVPTLEVVEINRPGDPPGLAARRIAAAAQGAALPEPAGDDEEADAAPTDALAETLGGPTRLDLQIRGPRRIFTRGRGLDAEWALDLAVRGTLAEPRVVGQARLLRGTFALAGRTFDLQERGTIRFDGDPTDALIDITAQNVGPELTVTVALSGSVQDPDIRFTSDPALPEDEILPQFLFGRSAGDLSPLEAAQLASSLATLAGRSSFDLVSTTRNLIQLDRLDIRQEETGVAVAGGRYITPNVYLELSRGALGETATKVEWRVRPRLYIISTFLTNGDQRLSVRWRRDLGTVRARR